MARTLDPYVAEWTRLQQRGGAPQSLRQLREEGLKGFLSLGFPTTRDEEWRFTSVSPIAEQSFTVPIEPSTYAHVGIDSFRLPGATAAELVFIDGHYIAALSELSGLPAGVRVDSLRSRLAEGGADVDAHLGRVATFDRHPFVALNTAFLDEGACISLPAGAIVETPIHLLFVSSGETGGQPAMVHPRVLVVAGAHSQASIVETYTGDISAAYLTNAVTEIALGEDAILNHYRVQIESPGASHIGALHVHTQRGAACAAHSISFGASLTRNDVVAVLGGVGAECVLHGLYLADGHRLVDNHTTIDHAQPHCGSREIYKGILAGHARGVFNGKIIVRPDAQKTDAKQTNRALLLSEDALMNTKPQLEIFANDVKCTHGAAIGQLDDEALFYLQSRGLSAAHARRLLIHAFAAEVVNLLPLESVRTGVERRLQRQLAEALPAAA